MAADDEEDAAELAKSDGRADKARGERGEGMECRRSGMMGRQLDEVESRSLSVVRHDRCTLTIDDMSSSYKMVSFLPAESPGDVCGGD